MDDNHCATSLRDEKEDKTKQSVDAVEFNMHDHNYTTTVRHQGSVGVSDGFSKPKLLIWSATSNCTGDDIHCASAATAISGDAVEGGGARISTLIVMYSLPSTGVRRFRSNRHSRRCGLMDVT